MIYLVLRHPAEGWLSKRVIRLSGGPTVLAWFRWALDEAKGQADANAWLHTLMDGAPYGLGSIFRQASELAIPDTWQDLLALLHEQLYVEGGPEYIRMDDEHSLRVRTNDDEVDLAYYFFDQSFCEDNPHLVGWLLQEEAPADGYEDSEFDSYIEADPLEPADEEGEGCSWIVLNTLTEEGLEPPGPFVIEGVRLPDLARHLASVEPEPETWPDEMRLLRACIDPEDPDLCKAFGVVAKPPLPRIPLTWDALIGSIDEAREELAELRSEHAAECPADVVPTLHLGQHRILASFVDPHSEYREQWILFDDLWAAKQPDLAQGLLAYHVGWDVLDEDYEED